ncbi:hypothetical protein HYU22_00190 [Candidatus Woesearchaeota archaeon]|nr:hypothetical protein [Candidatus Woesearchaeota archaeon]
MYLQMRKDRNYKIATRKKEIKKQVASLAGISVLSSLLFAGYYMPSSSSRALKEAPAAVFEPLPESSPEVLASVAADPRPEYQRINYNNPLLQQGQREHRFEAGFFLRLEQLCENLDMHCMSLLSVIHTETGGTFGPKVRNHYNGASGLIQFTNRTARQLGTTLPKIRRMPQVEQLDLVQKYFEFVKSWNRRVDYSLPRDVALAVFCPVAAGRTNNYVVATRGSEIYRMNSSLDFFPRDGRITSQEYARNVVKGYY